MKKNNLLKKNIEKQLPESLNAIPVFACDEVDSTNRVALVLEESVISGRVKKRSTKNEEGVRYAKAKNAASDRYALVVAEKQTAGRGRLGRSFFSPQGGIYMSLLIKLKDIDFSSELTGFFTTAAAVAVSRSIEETMDTDEAMSSDEMMNADKKPDLKTKIKWVNDVYMNGRKICGILAEGKAGMTRTGLEKMVIGIGLNYSQEEFPEDIRELATSLKRECQDRLPQREVLIAKITAHLIQMLEGLMSESKSQNEKRKIIGYARNNSYLIGEKITLHKAGSDVLATAVDLDDNTAGLVVEYDTGETEIITSGEVSVRKI